MVAPAQRIRASVEAARDRVRMVCPECQIGGRKPFVFAGLPGAGTWVVARYRCSGRFGCQARWDEYMDGAEIGLERSAADDRLLIWEGDV